MTKTALVTGGSGFIGSHLVEKLLDRGWQVRVFDIRRSRNLDDFIDDPGLRFIQGDIRDEGMLAEALTDDVAVVYHLSSIVGVRHYIENPLGVVDINVLGTRVVLDLASRHGTRVLLSSTSEVFGKNPKVPWAEDDDRVLGSTAVDRWSYASSKAMCEHMVLAAHRQLGLPVTVVRYFNAYGPRQAPDYVVSQSIYRVLRDEPPLLYDRGDQTRCFTFVDDLVEGTISAAESERADGEVFNLGSDQETTVRDVVETIIRLSGGKVDWQALDTEAHYGGTYEDIPRRVPDVTKARRLLDWKASTSLEDGLGATIEWARRNQWWLD